jgi:hypothetical protein
MLWIEQGAITMPCVIKEPLARRLPTSSIEYEKWASALKSAADFFVSRNAVRSADRVRIR